MMLTLGFNCKRLIEGFPSIKNISIEPYYDHTITMTFKYKTLKNSNLITPYVPNNVPSQVVSNALV